MDQRFYKKCSPSADCQTRGGRHAHKDVEGSESGENDSEVESSEFFPVHHVVEKTQLLEKEDLSGDPDQPLAADLETFSCVSTWGPTTENLWNKAMISIVDCQVSIWNISFIILLLPKLKLYRVVLEFKALKEQIKLKLSVKDKKLSSNKINLWKLILHFILVMHFYL